MVFAIKMAITPEGSDIGENVTEWARAGTLELGADGFQEGRVGRHLSAKHPSWAARSIGREIYLFTLVIIRGKGNDTKGRRINSRKLRNKNAIPPRGRQRRMGIDFSERAVSTPTSRSDEACSRRPVWSLRNIDGSRQSAKTRWI